jgi:hypothetical protein
MRTKLSIAVIFLVFAAVAYTAIFGNERTFAQGRGAGSGNWSGRPGAGRGGFQGWSDCGKVIRGRGAGKGNWSGHPGAGRGRGQGYSDCVYVNQGCGAGKGNWSGRPGTGRGGVQGWRD